MCVWMQNCVCVFIYILQAYSQQHNFYTKRLETIYISIIRELFLKKEEERKKNVYMHMFYIQRISLGG